MTANRGELEKAANAYFKRLIAEVDQPRNFADGTYEDEIDFQIEQSRAFIEQKDDNLREHKYSKGTRSAAHQMLSAIGLDFGALDASAQLTASNYAERAERQRMRYFLHSIERPVEAFVPDDHLFVPASPAPLAAPPSREVVEPTNLRPDITLERGISLYIAYQTKKGWQGSMKDESQRVLRWLVEEMGDETPVSAISQDQLREFRDCIQSLAPGHQGRKKALRGRLAEAGKPTLRFATKERYWRAVKAFFAYFRSDYGIPDPVADMLFEGGKNEVRRSPAPFSSDELQKLLKTPLFAGYKSAHRLKDDGDCHARRGHWWSGVLMMHTGLRAGDCAQLLPGDILLDHEVPHLIIRPGQLPEGVPKRSKFGPREHRVPLLPILFELGLREFVEERAKRKPKVRLLYEIGLGGNRMSNGMTKFWQPYLEKFGLYSHGRATHVFRHTVANRLRDHAQCHNEDIGAILGHSDTNTTAGYGGVQGLKRQLATLEKLDFGFDVLEALGGKYDPKRHA